MDDFDGDIPKMDEYIPSSRWSRFGAETKIAQLTKERTEARAEAFRAQERVRELEEMLAVAANASEMNSRENWSFGSGENERNAWDVVRREARKIAAKRREGK